METAGDNQVDAAPPAPAAVVKSADSPAPPASPALEVTKGGDPATPEEPVAASASSESESESSSGDEDDDADAVDADTPQQNGSDAKSAPPAEAEKAVATTTDAAEDVVVVTAEATATATEATVVATETAVVATETVTTTTTTTTTTTETETTETSTETATTVTTEASTDVVTTETIVAPSTPPIVAPSTPPTVAPSTPPSGSPAREVASPDAPLQLSDLVLEVSPDDADELEGFSDALQSLDEVDGANSSGSDSDEDDSLEHELQDFFADRSEKAPGSGGAHAGVPTTISYSVNEMEVITNRGGRSGSLSKFLDDADSYRRRSLQAYPDDPLFGSGLHSKSMSLAAFLDMGIDPILEILEDSDSDIRLWLMQPQTVKEVLAAFVAPPVFAGEPHEEYGYYKRHFVCSEIIMKLYTGEEDLYESFSSDSSSGSAAANAVFGCQEPPDVAKWAALYAVFDNPRPLDEMQLLFFSKALVRLHDGFCLEEGYVPNVLRRFLPAVVPHLYSNTVKYMLTLILQSYESVHPITGRNDAMEIVAPLLAAATRPDAAAPLNAALVENTSQLLVDMLQANQADRLGSFCRREGGVYLSKYFVRDQFGTIRGFESMTHGYHNFLQYMLLEELGKHPAIVDELFDNAHAELQYLREHKVTEASSSLNVHMATELVLLCTKYQSEALDSDAGSPLEESSGKGRGSSFGYGSFSPEQFASSPRESAAETSMYNLASLAHGSSLWAAVRRAAVRSAPAFVAQLDCGLAPSVEIALAKYLHALVALNDESANAQLHASGLIAKYLRILERRARFDMLLIHVVPAVSFILRDADGARAKNCPLTKDLFGLDGDGTAPSVLDVLLKAKLELPALRIYSAVLHDVLDEVFASPAPSQNNAQVLFHCKRSSAWAKLTGRSRSDAKRASDASSKRASDESDARRSSLMDASASGSPPPPPAPVGDAVLDDAVTGTNGTPVTVSNANKAPSPTSAPLPQTAVPPPPPPAASPKDAEKDAPRKSTHYFKNVLQSPVFKSPMRLGSVIKVPEKAPSPPQDSGSSDSSAAPAARGSFQWNSVFKKLRSSWVATHHSDKSDKKLLALSNEPFAHPLAPRQTDVLVVDTSRGDDVTKLVHADGGVSVVDVPLAAGSSSSSSATTSRGPSGLNVITSGYMYKNKLPETGQRHVWERFYFVLNRAEGSLSYYVSEAHAKDRTYVRGTARPVGVSEGLPVHVAGAVGVFGFQITTQGHGAFLVLVDSIDTRLTWLTEILVCVSAAAPGSSKRLSLLADDPLARAAAATKWSKQELRALVVELYKNLFGPQLKFASPLEAPASFWMEEKIEPVAEACVLSSNLPDCVPYWGEFHGYKRLCDYWKIRDETVERSSGRVLRIVVDEDEETAVVMTSTTFRILRNSEVVTEESCDILTMSGGAIVSIHCTFDSFRIADAFRKEGVSAS